MAQYAVAYLYIPDASELGDAIERVMPQVRNGQPATIVCNDGLTVRLSKPVIRGRKRTSQDRAYSHRTAQDG